MIYFDNAATTRPDAEVLQVYLQALEKNYGNPSSSHALGQEAARLLSRAREQIAAYLGSSEVKPEEVIFTSGATESNNLAIKGVAHRYRKLGRHLVTTSVEHSSVKNAFKELEAEGFEVTYLDPAPDGISPASLKNALRRDTVLVSVMAVNNEVGAVYDIPALSRLVHENSNALFHTDATQSLFKIKQSYKDCDLFSFSAHKLGGLKGSGLLIKRQKVDLVPLFEGGGQEGGYRSGTSNLPSDIALAATLRRANATFESRQETASNLREYLKQELLKIPEVEITSPLRSSPFILSFILKEHRASVVVEALSLKGIMVSTKSACSSKKIGGSHVLKAYGYSDRDALNGIRLSFSGEQTIAEGRAFIENLQQILRTTRKED